MINELLKNVTIITVTHNSSLVLRKFFESIDLRFKLIIVDNASSDKTKIILKNILHKQTLTIFNKIGNGFGKAANQAISKVKTSHFLLVNPDTILCTGSILKLYLASKRYKNGAIFSPVHINSNGFKSLPTKPHFFNGEKSILNINNFKGDCSVEHLSGAIMLIDKTKMNKIGFFDENFFLYYEDDDLCIRSRQLGFENILVYGVELKHFDGGSIGPPTIKNQWEKFSNMSYSKCWIEKKYFGFYKSSKNGIFTILRSVIKLFGHIIVLNLKKCLKDIAQIMGVFSFLLGLKK